MAIILYTGNTGSGKSYGVVEHIILPCVQQGRQIVTNVPLNRGLLLDYAEQNKYPDPQIIQTDNDFLSDPKNILTFPSGSVYVLDEVWALFPSGMQIKSTPKEYLDFIKYHRHRVGENGLSDEIVLISQSADDVALWIRKGVSETYIITKLENAGLKNSYRVDVYDKCPGVPRVKSQIIRELFGIYKPEVYKFYKSHTQISSKKWGSGLEKKVDKRANILKSATVKYGLPFSLLMLVGGAYAGFQAFKDITSPKQLPPSPSAEQEKPKLLEIPADMLITKTRQEKTSMPAHRETVNEPAPPAIPAILAIPVIPEHRSPPNQTSKEISKEWRLAAYLEGEQGARAYIVSRGGLREISASLCTRPDGLQEHQCTVDGEVITYWSGLSSYSYANSPIENATK